ncbi:hypothetical protein IDZ49_10675 [Francisella tularensis]|nr:hypothetical protein [Francisella tularensis]
MRNDLTTPPFMLAFLSESLAKRPFLYSYFAPYSSSMIIPSASNHTIYVAILQSAKVNPEDIKKS